MIGSTRRHLLVPAALAALLVPAVLVEAQTNGSRTSQIASPAANGSSDNTTFSSDARRVDLMGFDSEASNLAAGDTNGKRDVFILDRGSAEGDLSGRLSRVSVSGRNKQANGDSQKPSISGDQKRSPRCVVFESTATNLDRADRSPDSDVFLRDIKRRRTTLVSAGRSNARNGVVDGECEFVTFESAGSIYVRDLEGRKNFRIGRGANPDQQTNGKGVVFERGGQVYHQAFFKKFRSRKRGGPFVKKDGRATLVSASPSNSPGNGVSKNASADDNGFYVAFESTATNLCINTCVGVSEDRNGPVSDIFRRTISKRAPTKDRMQMVSFSFAVNEQGNGPSNNPAMTGAGENIVFDSEATNLRESPGISVPDPNGAVRDIYYWNFPRVRQQGNVSRESRGSQPRNDGSGQPLNGPSTNPSTSNRANYIGFTSSLSGDLGDTNGAEIADVFIRFLGGE